MHRIDALFARGKQPADPAPCRTRSARGTHQWTLVLGKLSIARSSRSFAPHRWAATALMWSMSPDLVTKSSNWRRSSSAAARTPGSRRFLKGGVVAGTFSLHADPITDIASRLRGQQIDFAANEGGRPDRLRAEPLPLAAVEGARTSGKVRCDNCHGTRKVTAR
jgi:hypothetical protein